MSADGKIDLARLSTAGAAPGAAIVLTNGRWKPGTAGGGGAMGYAGLDVTFGTAVSTNGSFTSATFSDIFESTGTPGVSVDGAGGFTLCTDSVPSLYHLSMQVKGTNLTGVGALDVCQISVTSFKLEGTGCWVGTSAQWFEISDISYTATSTPHTPTFKARCSGGTTQTMKAAAELYIARYAL